MDFEYTISEHDYVSAGIFAGAATKKQAKWLSLWCLILLLLAWFVVSSLKFVAIYCIFFGIICYFLCLYLILPLIAKRHYRQYKLLHQPLGFTLTDSGYTVKNRSGEITVKWSELLHWKENSRFVLLYFAPRMFHIVPKKLAEEKILLDKLKRYLIEHVGPAK